MVISQKRLYSDLSWTWPIISPPEHYVKETEFFSRIMKERNGAKTLLHLGCGGGHNDFTFKKYFEVTGVDLSRKMLTLAKKLNPNVQYSLGDMRTVRLEKQFDAVAILDSINYMASEEDLISAFQTAFTHLKTGGIFITYVEETKESFRSRTRVSTHKKGRTEITFIENAYDPNPEDDKYENTFVYLIRRNGRLSIETDLHVDGLFRLIIWKKLLNKTGFRVKQVEFKPDNPNYQKCPLFVCTKK